MPGKAEISGITPNHRKPDCHPRHFTQLCETDQVVLPGKDPGIEELLHIAVTIHPCGFREISTSGCKKLIAHAVKEVEVITRCSGVRFATKACFPFCAVVLLDGCCDPVIEADFVIEDIFACQMGFHCVAVSTVLLVSPRFAKGCRDDGSVRCDIRLSGSPLPLRGVGG